MKSGAAAAPGTDDVVRRAQQGELGAFEVVYREHAPAVYALCRRLARDEHAAKELVQDVFVRAWEKLRSFRGESAFGTWLHRLAVNVVLERGRATARERARTEEDAIDAMPDARAGAGSLESRLDLEEAIAQLPTVARTVFVLHEMHGYSHEEIARMTGMAASTARVQLWRARRSLMRRLDR